MKTCAKCSLVKNEESFSRHAKMPDGLKTWCKECMNAAKMAVTYLSESLKSYSLFKKENAPVAAFRLVMIIT